MKKLFLILFICSGLNANSLNEINQLIIQNSSLNQSSLVIQSKDVNNFLIYATRDNQKKPVIVYSQENFKKFKFSELELVLLFCHEIGHFNGGHPYKKRGSSERLSWSSAEGQADYYSTSRCLKEYNIMSLNYREAISKNITNEILEICNNFECIKVLSSIYNVIRSYETFINSEQNISFNAPDSISPSMTILSYPSAQCRLKTLVNGYFCQELNFHTNDCYEQIFMRPKCWYNE